MIRNPFDYFTVNKPYMNGITHVKTSPEGGCGAGGDHVPVIAQLKVRVKKNQQKPKNKKRLDYFKKRPNNKRKIDSRSHQPV